jgi:hypothetical protein
MEIQKEFKFRTGLSEAGSHLDEIMDLEYLYFIRLLPNELPLFGRQKMTLSLPERATMTVGPTRGSQETRTLLTLTTI